MLYKRTEKLSIGQKRRSAISLALAVDPDLLIFDEPTVGMDVSSRTNFWKTIAHLKERGKTIIFATQYLQEADDVAERMILYHESSVVIDGTPSELKNKLTKKQSHFNLMVMKKQSLITIQFYFSYHKK